MTLSSSRYLGRYSYLGFKENYFVKHSKRAHISVGIDA
jgi:hypothetical protein